jgi:hypothetical protein
MAGDSHRDSTSEQCKFRQLWCSKVHGGKQIFALQVALQEGKLSARCKAALKAILTDQKTGEGGHPLPHSKVFRQENSTFSGIGRPCRLK